MSVGISLTAPQFTHEPAEVFGMAQTVEEFGLDGVFLFDHLIPLGSNQRPILELASLLGALAARTSSCRVGSLVLRSTLRGPAITTAIAETVAAIAPGRVTLGLGAGDALTRDEAERMGLAFEDLDARLETLDRTAGMLDGAGLDVWIGGLHPRVRALAAQHGGWNGWNVEVEDFSRMADELRGANATVTWGGPVLLAEDEDDLRSLLDDRSDPPSIAGTPEVVAESLSRYVTAGADHMVVSVLPNRPERWRLFARRVVADLR